MGLCSKKKAWLFYYTAPSEAIVSKHNIACVLKGSFSCSFYECLFACFWEDIQQPAVTGPSVCHLKSTVFYGMQLLWPVTYCILHGCLAGNSCLSPLFSAWGNKHAAAEIDLKASAREGKEKHQDSSAWSPGQKIRRRKKEPPPKKTWT